MASKAEICIAIYAELVATAASTKDIRRQFIARAIAEAACTPAGAATYYANCKNRGGATGDTRVRPQATVGEYADKADYEGDDPRPLYSAVQPDRQGIVAAVSAWMSPEDAIGAAARVRGVAVLGAPEIGEPLDTLTQYVIECGEVVIKEN